MKKFHTLINALFIGGSLFCFLLAGCSKDLAVKQPAASAESNSLTSGTLLLSSDAVSAAINPTGFLGAYTVRDEKTIYIGQANTRGTNVLIHLSYIDVPTFIAPAPDKEYLIMPYGAAAYPDSGWAYIISYNTATKTITLAPNKAMIEDIVSGSFETLSTSYDPVRKEGSFVTRFTALKDNGNETQLSESFFK